ncbi:MAG: site-2 protease family protein [Myxococcota bacterium]|jgi:membrane-associated protease RseP (regulator of RpoE activity)|nr:site-2 protease family protein [Myxococcota bacterium]
MTWEPEILSANDPHLPPPRRQPEKKNKPKQRWFLHLLLFTLTFISAMWSQIQPLPGEDFFELITGPLANPERLMHGLPFATTLMAILLAHEMGHYLTARRYGVDQSLPYFIPAPTIFGTLGAIILMRSQPETRRDLLNVAVMGPYAGIILAIPAAAWGLAHSIPIEPEQMQPGQLWFGSSILFSFLENHFSPNGSDVMLHPVAFAGWVGMFVTSLNLIPAAQLDGGHVAYSLFGRWQEMISRIIVLGLIGVGFYLGTGKGTIWIFWGILLLLFGLRHPPVQNESFPLSKGQKANAIFALVLFVLTFIPVPIEIVGLDEINKNPAQQAPLEQQELPAVPSPENAAEEFKL